MKELSDWPFYEADISRLQLQAARPDFFPIFLSFFPCSVNQCLYVLWAADYSAYALWCFPRCRSNLFFCTVQHIMGVCESCLSRSSALVTAFQVGCSPSPLHHSLLLFFFYAAFYSSSPLSPLLCLIPFILTVPPRLLHRSAPHPLPLAGPTEPSISSDCVPSDEWACG